MSLYTEVASFMANLRQPWPGGPAILPRDGRLVLGVSGGPDSLALLHVLAAQGLHPEGHLVVAHLNHGLRPAADAEAEFVARQAAEWGVACQIGRRDVAELARAERLSLEEAGRVARYAFLSEAADGVGARVVATAHQGDDQAESVLMHLLRGSGLDGLRGMLPVGRVPGRTDLTLIRPLLRVTREAVEAYIREHDLHPVLDKSNEEATFYRNWLRLELLPLVETRNPSVADRLRQLAELARADVELLRQLAADAWEATLGATGDDWLALDRRRWRSWPLSVRRRLIRLALQTLRPDLRDVAFQPVEQARLLAEGRQSGGQISLPEVTMIVEAERLVFRGRGASADEEGQPQVPPGAALKLEVPGQVRLAGGWRIEAAPAGGIAPADAAANADPWVAHAAVPAAAQLVVRPRARGERFQPLGLGGRHALVSAAMVNRKIPARLRERWPIVAADEQLVWLVGHQLDERARVTEESERVVRLRLVRATSG